MSDSLSQGGVVIPSHGRLVVTGSPRGSRSDDMRCDSGAPGRVRHGLADGLASAFVLVIGDDVADRGVPDGVVLGPDAVRLEAGLTGVADLLQVRPLAFDVAEQRLDSRLVLRCVRAAELLGDRDTGHELAGGHRAHLRPLPESRAAAAPGRRTGRAPGPGRRGRPPRATPRWPAHRPARAGPRRPARR